MLKKSVLLTMFALLVCSMPKAASSELYNKSRSDSNNSQPKAKAYNNSSVELDTIVLEHVNNMRSQCLGGWEKQGCIKAMSYIAMDIATSYADSLHKAKKEDAMEDLKQHCAASTAAIKIEVPAYAQNSAITECVNIIADIHDKTLIQPNINLYQLLIGSVWCLSEDQSCTVFEQQISQIK